jgi:hypothetical protein
MFRSTFFKFLIAILFLTFIFCNKESGVLQSEGIQYGSLSGKIIHPDNNLLIRVISEEGIDSAARNPESQMFTFDSIKYGKCLLKVTANEYMLFEERITLDKPLYICHDIVLAQFPPQISYLYPPNSQYLDSFFFSLSSPSITDSGFVVSIAFNDRMDTTSFQGAFTILPDTIGVQKIWFFDTQISLFFPYWKLSTIDTVKVSISRIARNHWGDTLVRDCTVFYPVDTNFIHTILKIKEMIIDHPDR